MFVATFAVPRGRAKKMPDKKHLGGVWSREQRQDEHIKEARANIPG
jgi:hypothetical protein